MASDTKYVALIYNAWDSVEAATPARMPVQPMGKSCGFLLVYDSLEKLRADYPTCQYAGIGPVA